jgi:diphosphomevalonate decarboxylase
MNIPMTQHTATGEAGANIALTKYWGNTDDDLRIPANDSISLTLDRTRTVTTVSFGPDLNEDQVMVDGRVLSGPAREGVVRHLDLFRRLADTQWRARVLSRNSFPTAAGIASSASGFAALTAASAAALGLEFSPRELSRLARQGSGSAARSVFGGFALLHAGASDEEAFAEDLHGPDWWQVIDLVVILSEAEKEVPSTAGHQLAQTSPLHTARVAHVADLNRRLLVALAERDFASLGEVAEQDALLMHAVMITSRPTLLYWLPATLATMRRVRRYREEGLGAYFTIDAGPNVHVLTLPEFVDRVLADLQEQPVVQEVLVCRPGPGARVLEDVTDG